MMTEHIGAGASNAFSLAFALSPSVQGEPPRSLDEWRDLDDLFENAPDAYFVTSASGQISRINRMGRDLLGAPPGFAERKPLAVFVPPRQRRDFRRVLARAVLTAQRCEWRSSLAGWKRPEVPAAWALTTTRRPDGTVRDVRWIIRQISAVNSPESAASASSEAVPAVSPAPAPPVPSTDRVENQIPVDVLGTVARDLQNPLWVIMDQAGFLAEQLVAGETGAVGTVALSLANLAVFSGDVIAALGEVSDFAAFWAGRSISLTVASTDLSAVVHRVILTYRGITEVHRITLDVDDSGARGFIGEWDEDRLECALSNILSDALDRCSETSEIRVRLARGDGQRDSRAVVSLEYQRSSALDEPGQAPSDSGPRTRLTRGRVRGELLGFTGARWLIEQFGGTLERRDSGSGKVTVTANLPFWQPTRPAAGESESALPERTNH